MPNFDLELILEQNPVYGAQGFISLPIVSHIHKRTERFLYTQSIHQGAVPIAYIENPHLDSLKNIQLIDRSYSVAANSIHQVGLRGLWDSFRGVAVSSRYKDILITNQAFVDSEGLERPLFLKHQLPTGTKDVKLQIATEGSRFDVDEGYLVSLDAEAIFTNYENYFDEDTGSYRLYFVVSTTEDGEVKSGLLNTESAAQLATWEDVDLVTGALKDNYPLYSREKTSDGYTFYLNKGDTWYIKPVDFGLVRAQLPGGRDPDEAWFLDVSNGDVTALVNGAVRRYWVPEYHRQPFVPYKPYVWSPYDKLLYVRKNIVATTRKHIYIDPIQGFHLNVFIRNADDVLFKVLTTNQSLEGERYSDSSAFFESDKIASWDNASGFIHLGIDLDPSWEVTANYYYEARGLEYTRLNLNPLINPETLERSYVLYLVPNAHEQDTAIQHLIVDREGMILDCSQELGLSMPNLRLKNMDGTFNSSTVVGMQYQSETDSNSFISLYTAGFANDHAYMVLAEVNVIDFSLKEDQATIDVRRRAGVDPILLEDVIRANPRVLQSAEVYGSNGQDVPQHAVMVIEAPLSLLEDYGGALNEAEAEELMRTYMISAGHAIVDWWYPKTNLTISPGTGSATLDYTWEGPDYDYLIYRKDLGSSGWTLIHTEPTPSEAPLQHVDSGLANDTVYHYAIRVREGSVLYPEGVTISVRTN